MICPRCKKEHTDDTKYCKSCVMYQYNWKLAKEAELEPFKTGSRRTSESIAFLMGEIERLKDREKVLQERCDALMEVVEASKRLLIKIIDDEKKVSIYNAEERELQQALTALKGDKV